MAWHDQEGRSDDPPLSEFRNWLSAEEAFGHLPNGVDQTLVNLLLK